MSAIAASLQELVEPIDALQPWADSAKGDNPRRGDVGKIMASLERFGQVRPILAQQDGTIVAGNHTYLAAQRLGWDEVAVVRVNLSDDEAKAYLIADNRVSDTATYDDHALIAILNDIQESGSLEGTGFSADDLDDLVAAIEGVSTTDPEAFGGDYAEDPSATAARWEGRSEGQRREVVFLLPHADFERFRECVNDLKQKYDTDSMATAIYEAVYREATGLERSKEERDAQASVTEGEPDMGEGHLLPPPDGSGDERDFDVEHDPALDIA